MITYSFTKYAEKELRKLPQDIQQRIIIKIKSYIKTGNPLHFAETIKGEGKNIYRFRIGDYRVIFDWKSNNHIRVLKVRPRPIAYR